MTEPRKALIISLSGPSSSGKTTLARLLRDIFPSTFILHEDDFYLPEEQLPIKEGLRDWDCAEALDVDGIVRGLEYIKRTGGFPPDLDSKEDQNSVGKCPVSDEVISSLKDQVKIWTSPGHPGHNLLISQIKLCIFDGFLLYPPSMASIHPYLDIKFFLPLSHAKAKARREARSGYVTLEGFWEDPPGYVDKIVWPNYVRDHGFLFVDGNVEGQFRSDVLGDMGIEVPGKTRAEDEDGGMEGTLGWIVGRLIGVLPSLVGGEC